MAPPRRTRRMNSRRALHLGTAVLVLGLFGLPIHGDDPKVDPKTEYPRKVSDLRKKVAKGTYDVATYAFDKKCFMMANQQMERVLALDPDHEGAHKKLGHKKKDGKWERDPSIKVKGTNEAPSDVVDQVKETVEKKLGDLGKKSAGDFVSLAEWCLKNDLPDEARAHFTEALDFDANNEKARKALGFTKQGDHWVAGGEKKARQSAAEALKKAPEGDEVKEASAVEQQTRLKLHKRRSEHFFLQGHFPQETVKKHVRLAETTYVQFLQILEVSDDRLSGEYTIVHLASQADHERYIDAFGEGTEEYRKFLKTCSGYIQPGECENWQNGDDQSEEDATVHDAAHMLFGRMGGWNQKPWLYEGMAYYFSALILGTARTHCVGSERVQGGGGFGGMDTGGWKAEIRDQVAGGSDPDIYGVLGASIESISQVQIVKGWSLIDFFLADHDRMEKFKLFLQRTSSGLAQEKAMSETFHWDYGTLNEEWRKFVKATY